MKTGKRILALGAALVLSLTMLASSAFAASATTAPLVQDNAPKTGTLTVAKEGSEFTIYKIMDTEIAKGTKVYTYKPSAAYAGFFTANPAVTASAIAKMDSAHLEALAADLHRHTAANNIQPTKAVKADVDTKEAAFVGIELGYYLVTETETTGGRVASRAFLVSLPKAENGSWNYTLKVCPKDSGADLNKVIVEDGKDTAAVTRAIGEDVNYRIDADVPQYDATATNIVYDVMDSLSRGLDFKADTVKIYGVKENGDRTELTLGTNYSISTNPSPIQPQMTNNVKFSFVYDTISAFKKVEINYVCTLGKGAVIATTRSDLGPGNPNNAWLVYTNNPKTGSKARTPDRTVTVYTFGILIEKTNGASTAQKLQGAIFAIKDIAGNTIAGYTYNDKDQIVEMKNYDTYGKGVITGKDGRAWIVGLDEGTYFIEEVKAPDGFMLLKDYIKVEIKATRDEGGKLTNKFTSYVDDKLYTKTDEHCWQKFIYLSIVNYEGLVLPATGGIGTTVFTVTGIALIVCALGALLLYRRKSKMF